MFHSYHTKKNTNAECRYSNLYKKQEILKLMLEVVFKFLFFKNILFWLLRNFVKKIHYTTYTFFSILYFGSRENTTSKRKSFVNHTKHSYSFIIISNFKIKKSTMTVPKITFYAFLMELLQICIEWQEK